MMLLMIVVWLAVLGLILALVWRLIGGANWPGGGMRRPPAEEILRERYARGEIDRDTYQRMLRDLQGDTRP
jgi:putative membrane protein